MEVVIKKEIGLEPKLRFSKFKDKWLELKYDEVFSFYSTNSLSREKLNYERGEVKNIHYGDVHSKYSTMYNVEEVETPYINLEVDLSKVKDESYCKEGDLIIADASEDYNDIGKAIELVNLNKERVVAGLHTFLARPDRRKMVIGFSGYLVQSWKIRKQIMTIAQGTKVLGIATSRLGKIRINIPTLPEQQKIAAFLSAVDTKIQQLTKKKELLEQYKKGVMQQLFKSPLERGQRGGVRFKDENGADFPEWMWLGGNELFENISDKNHNSDLPILAVTQDKGAIPRDMIDYKMSVSEKSVASYKVVQVGDFVISLRTFQGGIEYSNYKGICSPAYIILRPNSDDVNRTFYRFYLKTSYYIKQLQKNLEGIRDGKMISYKYFSEIRLPFPSKEEQQKIANYLSSIDFKIGQVNTQIEKAQRFKKGLLQQMFV